MVMANLTILVSQTSTSTWAMIHGRAEGISPQDRLTAPGSRSTAPAIHSRVRCDGDEGRIRRLR